MPRPRLTEDQLTETRERIVAAAKALFDEGGVQAVTIRALAASVGMGPSTLYSYFGSTNEVLAAVWWDVVEALEADLAAAATDAPDPIARIAALVRAFVRFAQTRPAEFKITFLIADLPPSQVEMIAPEPTERLGFKLLYDAVREAADGGALSAADPALTAQAILASTYGAVAAPRTMSGFAWREPGELAEEILRLHAITFSG